MTQFILTKHWNLHRLYVLPALHHCFGEHNTDSPMTSWLWNVSPGQKQHCPWASTREIQLSFANTIKLQLNRKEKHAKNMVHGVAIGSTVGLFRLTNLILISLQISNMPVTEFPHLLHLSATAPCSRLMQNKNGTVRSKEGSNYYILDTHSLLLTKPYSNTSAEIKF